MRRCMIIMLRRILSWTLPRFASLSVPAMMHACRDDSLSLTIAQLHAENQRLRARIAVLEAGTTNTPAIIGNSLPGPLTWFDDAPVGIALLDTELRYQYINASLATLNGVAPEAHLGRTIHEVLPPQLASDIEKFCCQMLDTGESLLNIEMYGKDPAHPGMLLVGSVNYFPIHSAAGAIIGVGVVVLDITERKRTEEALRKNLQILHESQSIAHMASWMVDIPTGILETTSEGSPALAWMAGRQTLHDLLALVHPDDREYVRSVWLAAMHNGSYDIEYRIILNGAVRWLSVKATITYDQQHNPILAKGMVQDVTERKQAQIALRMSEEQYHGLIESLDSAIIVVDAEGRFRYMNDLAAAQMRSTPRALIGKTIAEMFPEPVASAYRENIRGVLRTDQKAVGADCVEIQGRRIWYHTSMQPIHNETGCPVYVLINLTDINDLKIAQQDLEELNRTLEERVNQRTAEVQDLYENAPVGYYSLDADGMVIRVNQTQLTWFGYTRDEMIGHPYTDFISEQSRVTFWTRFPLLKEQGWLHDTTYECVRKDGTTFPALLRATAIYDEHGTYIMSRSTITDITLRKQAEDALRESEAQNRLLFKESPDPIVLFDNRGVIMQTNRAFDLITGYTSVQLVGRTPDMLEIVSHAHMTHFIAAVTHSMLSDDKFFTTDFRLKNASGRICDVKARLLEITIQGRPHYLTAMHDITTEKQTEAILNRANVNLARVARAKDEFLANMSHELRTPLNAILGLSESLQEHIYGLLNTRQQKALQNIEASGRHLLTLINDILDLSKVEAGYLKLEFDIVSVVDVCQSSLMFVKELALKKRLQISFHLDDQLTEMKVDPKRMKQMLVNLLSNAVKFTLPKGQVNLRVTADAAVGIIFFTVEDTGIGIAPDGIAQLFQPFQQLDSRLSRQHEGTGLGLSLVRHLADLHGGSVTVESTVGQGSRFTIALPYHPPHAVEAKPQMMIMPDPDAAISPPPQRTPTGARILLAEDNEANILTMSEYLQNKGYQICIARTGQEAIDHADAERPDLILMDIQMPVLDGLEATRRLRAKAEYAATPIIALTALSMPGDRERCLAAGASDYMTKPVRLRELAAAMERLLR